MKANELMIGDLVDFYHPYEPEKKIVTRHRVTEIFECGLVGISNHPNPVHADHIEPIPLTPEILEKNGMHLYNRRTNSLMERCNHSDCFKEDENFRVELSLDNDGKIRWTINGDEYTMMPLDYVHQLQHALRLCGINKEITL